MKVVADYISSNSFFSQRANAAEGGAPSGNLAGHRHERRRARLQLQACVWNRPGTLVGTAGGRVGTTSQAHRQRWSCVPRPGLYLARPRPNGVAAKPTGSGRKTSTRGDTLRGDSTWLAHQNVSLGRGRVRCLHDVAFSPPLCLMQLQWIASGRSAFGVTGPWLLRMCTSYGTSLEEVVCAVWSPLGVATIALCLSVDNLIYSLFLLCNRRAGIA